MAKCIARQQFLARSICNSKYRDRNGACVRLPPRVLDFGGGAGVHYFTARFLFNVPFRWAIVETPVRAAAAAPDGFEIHDSITSAVASLGEVDLVLASSAIQYTPDPMATLNALIAVGARYFALTRFPVSGRTAFGIERTTLSYQMNLGTPLPDGIVDRPLFYPIAFAAFDDVQRAFGQSYERIMMLLTPSGNYQIGDSGTLSGAALLYRRPFPT